MAFVKVMVHAVWGTKNRAKLLTKEIRPILFDHIKDNARSKEIYIDTINGFTEHVHILFGLNADLSLSKTLQLIKGESSFWVNKNKIIPLKFEWADEYFAASVSESNIDKVRDYIRNQEEHHKTITFAEEYEEFIKKYGAKSHG